MPTRSARSSISASCTTVDCGTPNPRKAPATGPLVYTARVNARTLGHEVGPARWIGARFATVLPRRHRRGIEVTQEIGCQQAALHVAREARVHACRMALGGGQHRLGACVHAAHRALQLPRRHREQRLYGDVELAAEATADGGRHDVHLLFAQADHPRDLVAVHVRGLCAGEDAQPVRRAWDAQPLGIPGLGLDVSMLYVARREESLRPVRRLRQSFLHIALHHAPADEDIVGSEAVERPRFGTQRRVDVLQRRLGSPLDRHVGIVYFQHGLVAACERGHGFAAEAHLALGEHRLVFDLGKDAKPLSCTSRAVSTSTSPG